MSKIVKAAAVVLKVGGESRYLYRGDAVPSAADPADVDALTGLGLLVDADTREGKRAAGNPEGTPSDAWTLDQFKTYTTAKGIDASKARTKAQYLAAIAEAEKSTTGTTPPVVTKIDDQGKTIVNGEGAPAGETDPAGTVPASE